MMDKRHLVLIGIMGSGKTTVGAALSAKSGRAFYDTDALVVVRYGMTIAEMFSHHGEAYFRDLETEAARYAASLTEPSIIATGGGIVLKSENMEILKESGFVVYLRCSPEILAMRLSDDTERPLLAGVDLPTRIKTLLKERSKLYLKYSDVVLDGDAEVNKVVERITGN